MSALTETDPTGAGFSRKVSPGSRHGWTAS